MKRKKLFIAKATILSLVLALVGVTQFAQAAAITSLSDEMTRLKTGVTADHEITFTIPADFNLTTATDVIRVDFPTAFAAGGTWAAADFVFNEAGSDVVATYAEGTNFAGASHVCSSGSDNVMVYRDTDLDDFYIVPCATYTGASAGAIIFKILGTAGNGTYTNPAANSYTVTIDMCDGAVDNTCEASFSATYSGSLGVSIVDDDRVTLQGTIDPTLTFDIDTSTNPATETDAPYSVDFGSITLTDTRVSGTTDSVNLIVLEADTNANSGVGVTVRNANGVNGLKSSATPDDDINSTDGTIADGTENYGLCVISGTLSGFTIQGGYIGNTCAVNSETNVVDGLTTTGASIVGVSTPVSGAHAEVVANAAIDTETAVHTDYTDTLTFIATGTF